MEKFGNGKINDKMHDICKGGFINSDWGYIDNASMFTGYMFSYCIFIRGIWIKQFRLHLKDALLGHVRFSRKRSPVPHWNLGVGSQILHNNVTKQEFKSESDGILVSYGIWHYSFFNVNILFYIFRWIFYMDRNIIPPS